MRFYFLFLFDYLGIFVFSMDRILHLLQIYYFMHDLELSYPGLAVAIAENTNLGQTYLNKFYKVSSYIAS